MNEQTGIKTFAEIGLFQDRRRVGHEEQHQLRRR
jgi:hypothetical protein